MKRVAVFVDLSNLYYCCLQHLKSKPDYRQYLEYCKSFGDVTTATAYGTDSGKVSQSFNVAMRHIGFTLKYKQFKEFGSHTSARPQRKADWDVGIAMDIVTLCLAGAVDVIVLGSADGDMAPVIEWCQKRGVTVIVLACRISFELREAAQRTIEIPPSMLEQHA